MDNICCFCSRTFSCKTSLERHKWDSCFWLHKSKKEKIQELEKYEPKLSDSEQDQMIRQLFHQLHKQSEQIASLQRDISYLKQKQKIDILKTINANIFPSKTVNDWINNLSVTDHHLEVVFQESIKQGILAAIRDSIESSRALHEKLPICAFEQKAKTLYIYDNEKKWISCDIAKMKKLCVMLSARFFDLFVIWQTNNEQLISEDETVRQRAGTFGQKVMDNSYMQNSFLSTLIDTISKQIQITFQPLDFE